MKLKMYFFCRMQKMCVGFVVQSFTYIMVAKDIQSTLVISKSKEPSETLRDIRTSTYQICRIEENANRTTKFHK